MNTLRPCVGCLQLSLAVSMQHQLIHFVCLSRGGSVRVPSIWYESHLYAKETGLHTAGVQMPGFPVTIIGHNEHVCIVRPCAPFFNPSGFTYVS